MGGLFFIKTLFSMLNNILLSLPDIVKSYNFVILMTIDDIKTLNANQVIRLESHHA